MPSVIIGPEFFKKEFKEYDNWRWAWVREINQNSIDAGSSSIRFELEEVGDDTVVEVTNDGDPMTKDILVNKLLALGASGKNFDGSTGGFGKAKNILLFCHRQWAVESGTTRVEGVGGEYEISEVPYFHGTKTRVVMAGHQKNELLTQINKFIDSAQWKGEFIVGGVVKKGDLRKGSFRRDLGFGLVYTNRSFRYTLIVRINGIPMFNTHINMDRCVIIELKGRSDEVLTANRDGLLYQFKNELYDFVTELAVDKRSALKNRSRGSRYVEYRGTKLCHVSALNVRDIVAVPKALPDPVSPSVVMEDVVEGVEDAGPVERISASDDCYVGAKSVSIGGKSSFKSVATIGTNFILKNETDLKIPDYFDPGSGSFSSYSQKLVKMWGRVMFELHRLFDASAVFSVGFVFDDSSEAECENGAYGLVYYLNPCEVVEQRSSFSKSFKKRFLLTDRDRLIAIGAHEFVHSLGYNMHDERYACKYTDVMGVVMKNRSRFNWCFK